MSETADPRLVTRIALRNYKSIAACDVPLAPLSFLVGPNGCGKSNFLDALRFVAEALRFSLDHALRDRGGIQEVRRRSGGHPNHFGIRLDLQLPSATGWYAFRVAAKPGGRYSVQREECVVFGADERGSYRVADGKVIDSTIPNPPACASDRLYLVNMSGFDLFRRVYDALSGMGFYNLNPDAIRDLQAPDPGDLLKRDGSNLASVLANLGSRKTDVEEYLAAITPGVTGVDSRTMGTKLTLDFRQEVRGAKHPWRFLASNMSDGTLRALGVLVALFQGNGEVMERRHLVGIEEPESALHPAAAGVLVDSLTDASQLAQVVVTSHSAELLDNDAIPDSSILAVLSEHAETRIGPLDDAGRSALRDHLFTAGELLRMDQLHPDPAQSAPRQLDLFERAHSAPDAVTCLAERRAELIG
ncbi:MAG: AAA family ATPase [Spirochaetaceae bacterium]|nr:AAA family ATPase [Spirochaetaceae bacterium]